MTGCKEAVVQRMIPSNKKVTVWQAWEETFEKDWEFGQRREKELACLHNTVDWSLNKGVVESILGRADWRGPGVGLRKANKVECNTKLDCSNLAH